VKEGKVGPIRRKFSIFSVCFLFAIIQFSNQKLLLRWKNIARGGGGGGGPPPPTPPPPPPPNPRRGGGGGAPAPPPQS
jgi:hypothetical protein